MIKEKDIYDDSDVIEWCGFLSRSFNDLLGRPLVAKELSPAGLTQELYNVGPVILSHKFGDVNRFCFANKAAQDLWGYSWDEFIGMDSSLSAESDVQEDRDALLKRAAEQGYIDDYSGIRIAKDGQRFEVSDVTLWNVSNDDGKKIGQAAIFKNVEFL